MTEKKTDLYAKITDRIIADLENGVRPWSRPWSASGNADAFQRPRRSTGEHYQGINVLVLWSEALDKGYKASTWMTYKQASDLGAFVRKGEKGTTVVYANRFVKTETNSKGEDVERAIPFLKAYTVFNVEQIEGLDAKFYPVAPVTAPADPLELHQTSEEFFGALGATVRHGGDRAFYQPSADIIQLPNPDQFKGPDAYAATKAHEFIHWTSASQRLDRTLGKRFGDDQYAAEELIAEIGAAFVCADLGVSAEPREDHSAYVAHWVAVLKADKRAIFTAASQAQKAVDYLHKTAQPAAVAA